MWHTCGAVWRVHIKRSVPCAVKLVLTLVCNNGKISRYSDIKFWKISLKHRGFSAVFGKHVWPPLCYLIPVGFCAADQIQKMIVSPTFNCDFKEFDVLSFVGMQTRLEMSGASPPPPELAAYLPNYSDLLPSYPLYSVFCRFVCFIVVQNTQISPKYFREAPMIGEVEENMSEEALNHVF